MSLNERMGKFNNGSGGRRLGIQNGPIVKPIGGKTPVSFRILPAFDPANPDPRTSWLPFAYAGKDGATEFSDWGVPVRASRYVGHSMPKHDLLSLRTYNPDDSCPLDELVTFIQANKEEWGYLTSRPEDRSHGPMLSRPSAMMAVNALMLSGPDEGQILVALLPSQASNNFLFGDNSPILMPNYATEPNPNDFCSKFQLGDITFPGRGFIFTIAQDVTSTAAAKPYLISLAKPIPYNNSATGQRGHRPPERPLTQDEMARRVNLLNFDSYLNKTTRASLIKDLVSTFNGFSPSGIHEYHMLRAAFPQEAELIPDPPANATGWGGGQQRADGWSSPAGQPGGWGAATAPGPQGTAPVQTPATAWTPPASLRPGAFGDSSPENPVQVQPPTRTAPAPQPAPQPETWVPPQQPANVWQSAEQPSGQPPQQAGGMPWSQVGTAVPANIPGVTPPASGDFVSMLQKAAAQQQ